MGSADPYWPAMMRREKAARYCDMTPTEFEGEVTAQRLPMPVRLGRCDRWNRKALDAALERLGDGEAPDWRATASIYVQG